MKINIKFGNKYKIDGYDAYIINNNKNIKLIIPEIKQMQFEFNMFVASDNDKQIFQKIIDSIKFIHLGVNDWTSYKNKEYGFVLKYPKTWQIDNPDGVYKNYPATEKQSMTLLRLTNHKIDSYVENNDISVSVGIYKTHKTIKEWYQNKIQYKTDQERIDDLFKYSQDKKLPIIKKDIIVKTEYDNQNNKIKTLTMCKQQCAEEGLPYTIKEMYYKNKETIFYISAIFASDDYDKYNKLVEKIFSSFEVSK